VKLKKGWKQIVFVALVAAVAVSYIITSLLVRLKTGFEMDMVDTLATPTYIYDHVMTDENLKMIVLFIPVICLAVALYLLRKNIFAESDYESASGFGIKGTAEWGIPSSYVDDEVFSKQSRFYKNDFAKTVQNMREGVIVGKVPGKNQALVIPDNTKLDTKNVLVHAPTGGGKGQSYVLTNLINIRNENLIVIDPKGENYELTSQLKRDQGYKVYNIDFVNFNQSRYNPLDYVKNDEDANNIADIITMNATSKDGNDFFASRAKAILAALISYVKSIYTKEEANMATLIDVYNNYVADEKTCEQWLQKIPDDNPAKPALLAALQALKSDTRASVIGNFDDIIATFVQQRVKEMTKVSDFDFREFQKQKSVVYVKIKIPYNEKKALTSMFFSQMIDTFFSIGEEQKDTIRLNIPVHFMLDEFANIGKIPNYDATLAFCRGYNIFMHTIIQDISQIQEENMYGKEKTKTIIANHSAKLLLKIGEQENAKYWQEHLGNKTAKYKSESTSISKQGKSTNLSDVYEEVPLMPTNELLEMNEQKAVLILTGFKPLFVDKAWQFQVFKGLLTNSNRQYCYEESRKALGYNTPVYQDEEQVESNNNVFEEFQNENTVNQIQGHIHEIVNDTLSDEAKKEFAEKKMYVKHFEAEQSQVDAKNENLSPFERLQRKTKSDQAEFSHNTLNANKVYTAIDKGQEETADDIINSI